MRVSTGTGRPASTARAASTVRWRAGPSGTPRPATRRSHGPRSRSRTSRMPGLYAGPPIQGLRPVALRSVAAVKPMSELDDPYCLDPAAARTLLDGAPWRRLLVLGDSIAAHPGDPV